MVRIESNLKIGSEWVLKSGLIITLATRSI